MWTLSDVLWSLLLGAAVLLCLVDAGPALVLLYV